MFPVLLFSQQKSKMELDSLRRVLNEVKHDSDKLKTLLSIDWVLWDVDTDVTTRFDVLLQALALAEKTGNTVAQITTYNRIGLLYTNYINYSKAYENFLNALKLTDRQKYPKQTSYTYMNLGIFQYYQKNYEEAINFYKQSLEIRRASEDKKTIATTLYLIGLTYIKTDSFRSALPYLKESVTLNEEINSSKSIGEAYEALGKLYIKLQRYDSAEYFLIRSLNNFKEQDNTAAIILTQADLARLYIEKKDFNRALFYARETFNFKSSNNYLRQELMETPRILSEIYAATNKMDSAYFYLKSYLEFVDSAEASNSKKEILNIEANFKLNQKQNEIDLLNKDKKIERTKSNAFIVGFGLMAIIAMILFTNVRQKKRSNEQLALKNSIISTEKERSEKLLLNILPSEVAEELKEKGQAEAHLFENVTVMFTDFVNFTKISEELSPTELVKEIHYCFSKFDEITGRHGMEKIKTIGDAYLAVSGLPTLDPQHAVKAVNAAIEIRDFITSYHNERINKHLPPFAIRIGLNSGPVVAGIVGVKKFAYDIWGDTVNTAARMEQNGEPGRINISGNTFELIKETYTCEHRGKIPAKNKGQIDMYFVN